MLYTTFPIEKAALACGRNLLEARLCACFNLLPMTSLYRWQGQIEQAQEVGVLIKTLSKHKQALIEALRLQHPYQTPVVFVLSKEADEVTRQWLTIECG